MIIKIKTSEVRDFFKRANAIKDNGILPIYAYIKFECKKDVGKLYKSNGNSFVVHDVELTADKEESIMVEEKMLIAITNKTSAEEITIESKKIKDSDRFDVTFTDGTQKLKSQSYNVADFSKIPEIGKEKSFLLPSDVISSLSLSKGCAKVDPKLKMWMCYVYIQSLGKKKSCIFGTNGVVMYYKTFDFDLPAITFELETCGIIGSFGELEYTFKENFHFFNAGKTIYGFINCEAKPPDISPIISQFDNKSNFTVSRKDLLDFCETVEFINNSALKPIVYIKDAGKNAVQFSYANSEMARSNEITLDVKKTGKVEDFPVMSEYFVTLFKGLDFDSVRLCGPIKHSYFVTSDEDPSFIGMVREVMFNNEAGVADTGKAK